MSLQKTIRIYVALLLVLLLGLRTFYRKDPTLSGETMGTTYSVKIKGYVLHSAENKLSRKIEETLSEINRQMSTWDPDSEISIVNHSDKTGPFPVSAEFATVVTRALEFAESTSGAFDPTLQPLLNLWGFGSESGEWKIPSEEEIVRVLTNTGPDMVWLEDSTNLWKSTPEVQLDLGAIAKGYGVDVISRLLDAHGYENWFVEIGGEVSVRGVNPQGNPWRIGIQFPSGSAGIDQLQGILHLTNGAVATSGDYRNFIEQDGKLYTHIIDPWSGNTILTNTASVTVFTPSCLDADAAATALFVFGADVGMAWVEEHPEAEAMFLLRDPQGEIHERFSSGFTAATGYISQNETP